jgi:hypothetical protein
MTTNDTKAMTYADGAQKIDLDEHTAAKVVESLVLRGDLSGLGPRERANHYIAVCHGLGLNPASKPLDYLKLNGKEILYPNKGATDQLAAIHKVTREIIDGPKVMDLAGTKLVYALCRASLPGGRFETSVATVPLVDPVNVLMKVETKAKRRATLSILGLGMLDEMELETIPASAQGPGGGVDLSDARLPTTTAQEPPQRPANPMEGRGIEDQRRRPQNAAETPAPADIAQPVAAPPKPADITDAQAEFLDGFYKRVAEIELPGECVAVWLKHRVDVSTLPARERENSWKAIVSRCEEVGKMRNAKLWLKKAIAEEDERRNEESGQKPTAKGVKTLDAQTDAPAATEVTP